MPTDNVYRSPRARAAVLADYDAALAAWPVGHETRYVDTPYGRTHVVVSGPADAEPVVLLHGGGGSAVDWRFNVADLAAHYRVYMPDIVGEPGKSEGLRPKYATHGHVAWLEALRPGLGIPRFRVAGASLGSWVAWQYALQFPEQVTHLAIISPPNLAAMRAGFLSRAVFTAVFPTAGVIRRFQQRIFSPATPLPGDAAIRAAVTRWKAQRRNPPPIPPATTEDISRIPEHARVLVGEDEPLYAVPKAVALFERLGKRQHLTLIPAAGHALTYEQSARVNEELLLLFGHPVRA